MDNLKEYTDDGDGYAPPSREFCNDDLEIRLYCEHKDCMQYIIGIEGYNGAFTAENGQRADLRNQCFYCEKHRK
jgi:hypothetical protein